MTFIQKTALSSNLGALAMVVGATTGVFLLAIYRPGVNLATVGYGYIALWLCVAFFAFHLKRNRIVIDESQRKIRVRACWCFFFWKDELTYDFETLQCETFHFGDGSGINIQLTCPDGKRVAVYDGRAMAILLDVIPDKPNRKSNKLDAVE